MKLYHFAAAHMIDGIKSQGLTKGMMPILDNQGNLLSFVAPCQWLTKDGNWENQAWATQRLISYDRTAYRLLVVIPKSHYSRLHYGTEILRLPISEGTKTMIRGTLGHEKWAIFLGNIPPGWIRRVVGKYEEPPVVLKGVSLKNGQGFRSASNPSDYKGY